MGSRRVQFCLLALLLVHTATGDKCKPSTCFSSNKTPIFNPKSGQQFTYDFESTAIAQLANKESTETSVGIRGQAIVSVGDNCAYTLTLQNVFATGADNSKQNVKDFSTHPVQFSLSGDELSTEICADDKETMFSLNIKRGIISAFQNGLEKSSGFDIFGKCPVTGHSSTSDGITTISRSRNLDECSYREKIVNGLMQGITSEASSIKTSPLLNGKVESEAKFKDGVLQSSEIQENYKFLPFSTQEHGGKARVNTKLTLKNTGNGAGAAPKTPVARSILYSNANENLASQKVKDSIKTAFDKALKEFTGQEGRLTSSAATSFAELVRLMRLAKRADLAVSYQLMNSGTLSGLQSENKDLSRSLFLDALYRTGTGDSVAALVDLSKKELNDKEKNLMYLSFNLVSSVTKEALTELSKLFKDNLPKEAYLSIGSIVNKYCRERGCDATEVKPIADKFVAKIPKDCVTKNRKDEEHLVAVLKGIRNSQTILNSALNQIISCASNQRPSRVRVAALQAFTANPCQKKLQQSAITVMKQRDEDSEVRIEAYLAAMECPTGALANEVQALLDSETINQVGTFITTHLDSIKASTDPKRETARHHFRNLRTTKKFSFDPRRYSFNREVSYAIDSLGLGSAVDTSVIYSQRSFLPRSIRLNVTGNLFGNSFNFMELSARQENLESLIERYFGPRGLFNTMRGQEIYDALLKEFGGSRSKRALANDLAQFDKGVKMSNEYSRETDIDVSMKMFGQEMYFLSLSQNVPSTPGDFLKFFTQEMEKGIDALKNFNYNFENHALWLDSDVTYPTAFGLPFKLSATGASAVKVDLSGSFDVRAFLDNPFDSKIVLNFSPAANLFISGTMGFNSYAFESGIEVAGTIYTTSGANTTFKIENGKSLIVEAVPTSKDQYLIQLSHQISTVTQESGREALKMPVKFKGSDQSTNMCFDQIEFLTGAAYCFDIQSTPPSKPGENALWPLYGSNKVGVKMEMADSITFRADLDMNDPEQPQVIFRHDTPIKGQGRTSTLKLLTSIKPTHYSAGFELSLPLLTGPFQVNAKVGFVNEDAQKKLYGHGNYEKSKYEYEIGFKKNGADIQPILKLNTDVAYISGKITERQTPNGMAYQLQQIRFGKDDYLTTVDGSIEIEQAKIGTKLKVDVAGKPVNVDGTVSYDNGKLQSQFEMKSPAINSANGKLKYDFTYGDKKFGNDLDVVWDKDFNSQKKRFVWTQFADWNGNCKVTNEINIGMIDAAGKFNGEFGKKIINLDSMFKYQKSNAELKIDNKYSQKQPYDFETSLYAMANQKSIKIELSRDIENESSRLKNKIELSTGLRLEFNGKVSHKLTYRDADVSLQALFVPGMKKEQTKVLITLKNTQKEHQSNMKVTTGKNEIASGETKLTYGPNMKGLLKGNFKDIYSLDGTYESQGGKGKGDLNVVGKDRKIRAESQFTFQKPTFDFTGDFFYDYERDNTKKIHFDTKNQISQGSFDSKNVVEIFTEKYGFNVLSKFEGKLQNGKQLANVEISLPTGRKFTTTYEREASFTNTKGNGKAHLTATDELPNHQQRQLIVDAKMNNVDLKSSFFDFIGSMKYKDYDNKDIKLQTTMKNLAKGHHFSTANGVLQLDGTMMPHAFTLNVNLDEYCSEHAIYSFNSKYGNVGNVDLSGKFYKKNKDHPYSHEFTGTLNVPNTSIKKLVVSSKGAVSEPEDENGVYGIKYAGSLEYAANKIELDTELHVSKTKGTGSAKITLPNQKPVSGDFKFNCNHQDAADFQANLAYGDNKKMSTTFKGNKPDENSFNMQYTLHGDLEQFKDLSFNYERKQPQEDEVQGKLSGKLDGKNFAVEYDIRASTNSPKFHVSWSCPNHNSKIFAEAQLASMLKGKGSLKIEKVYDFDLDGSFDGDLSSLENFYVRCEIDSPVLKINKYAFDVKSKDAGGRSGIEYKVTSNGKPVVSGTSDFTTKTDKGRTIIEGKSTIKLAEGKSDDVQFKIIRNVYERTRDGEVGFGGIVTVNVGPRNYAGEVKMTDKEFHTKYSGCAKKNTCTSVETRSVLEKSTVENFKHNLMMSVDLRQIGFPHEFGLKADTNRDGLKFNTAIDAYLQSKDKPEYQYSAFANTKEAGAIISTPKREIAFDAKYKFPTGFYGVYDTSLVFYLDKRNKPQMKSEFGFNGEVKHTGTSQMNGKGEIKFSHPFVQTPLRVAGDFVLNADQMEVSSNVEFDVFAKPLDKIVMKAKFGNSDTSGRGFNVTSDVEVFSQGLDFKIKFHEHAGASYDKRLISYGSELTFPLEDFRFGCNAFVGEKNYEVVTVIFNEEVLKMNAQYDVEKQNFGFEGTFKYLNSEPFTSSANLNGLTEGKFSVGKGNLFNVNGGYGIGKNIFLIVKGSGKEVFNGAVALDTAHFAKTNYKVDDAAAKQLSQDVQQQIRTDMETAEADVKQRFEKAKTYGVEKSQKMQKALPDFKRFNEDYLNELKKISEEIRADENVKKFMEIVTPYIEEFMKYVKTFNDLFSEQLAVIQEFLTNAYTDAIKGFNEKIMPELERIYATSSALLKDLMEQATKSITAVFERAAKALKVFEEDFNKVSQTFKDLTGGTFETLTQYVKEIIQEFKDLYQQFRTQLKELPGLEVVREKYQEYFGQFTPLQAVGAVIDELLNTFVDLVPEQAKPFLTKMSDYLRKKMNNEEVNDMEILKDIYKTLFEALQAFKVEYADTLNYASTALPFSFDALKRVPMFITNIRFSAFNRLTSEPIVSLKDFLYLYRPYAFNPREALLPFTMHGEIADGSHIFTFDGRHLTFPGDCSYILARDFVEGNFSIIANLKSGKMNSITVSDKNGQVEVTRDGLKYKDKDAEFPVHDKTLHAWRDYFTFNILSQFGASVQCSIDLTICHIEVSGFYSGRTRGLMGNGNNEPYDDYTLPNGKITDNTAEFGNAYKTQKTCAQVTASGDDHPKSHSNNFCSEFFGRDSNLRLGFLFVNPTNYREACEHATHGAANAQEEACKIARIYVSRLRNEFLPISIPKACSQCTVGSDKVDVGDEVSVKVPQKQADIVVVFDTSLGAQLSVVTEIMNEVRKELKTQGINDVNVAAIGYSANDRYASIYTTKGGLDFTGKFESVKPTGIPEDDTIKTGNKEFDDVVVELEKSAKLAQQDYGVSPDARAYYKAVNYPFRPTASKTIFAVRSDGIPYSLNPSKLATSRASIEVTSLAGIQVHSLVPIKITEPADKAKNIVGFNNNVALLINEKKRPNMGSVEMNNKLKYESDMGVDLTRETGYVFNLNNVGTDKKKFTGIVSYVLADTIARTEVVSDCKCGLTRGIYPEIFCKAKEKQLLAPKKGAARG